MESVLSNAREKMEAAINSLEHKFTNVRAGRANPNILEGINISYYGVDTPIKSLANISIPEARQLMIKPFDKNILGDIEKAIFEANIGLTPNNNGEVIILNIPALTEERRLDYVKQVKTMAEDCRIVLRNIRQDINNDIKKSELTDDEKEGYTKDIQDLINKYNKIVDEKTKIKETELMTV